MLPLYGKDDAHNSTCTEISVLQGGKAPRDNIIFLLIVVKTWTIQVAELRYFESTRSSAMLLMLCLSLTLSYVGRLLWLRYFAALAKIPGPFLPSVTSLWRWDLVRKSQFPWSNAALHDKYGPLVRIGPNHVSASSLEAVHKIYVTKKGFQKSAIYDIFQPSFEDSPLHNVFSTQDIGYHTSLKRRVGAFYSMATIQTFEDNIDRAINAFTARLTTFAEKEERVDMSAWLQYYTFDAQGEINFSKPIGFIEAGKDVGGFCHLDHEMMMYFAKWGQITNLERIRTKILSFVQNSGPNPLFEFTLNIVQSRLEKPDGEHDFLSKLVELHRIDPSKLSLREVIAGVYINIVTGHDVTAIQLRALVYYVARSPKVYARLRAEIAAADEAGKLSTPVRYTQASSLVYLSAVIQETLRIHPSAGLPLERYVPPGGVILHDTYIPQGTIVGVNAWAMNRTKAIFGDDAEDFRPERWIDDTSERIHLMRSSLFTWGSGARSCIGKNMALLQLYKVTVELYRNFSIKLADPARDWDVVGGWLTRQTGMDMILTPSNLN